MQEIIEVTWLGIAGAIALGAGGVVSVAVAYHLFDVSERIRKWFMRQNHDD